MDNLIFDKAQSVIKQRRLDAVNQNDMRINEISHKIPEINEINKYLINTGREIIRVISERKNVEAEIDFQTIERFIAELHETKLPCLRI